MRLLVCSLLLMLVACTKTTPPARAFQISSRAELIGGKRALGDVEAAPVDATDLIGGKRAQGDLGDFKLTNGVIHAIIQNVGTSRGFGSFGGSLIDVDLVRNGAGSAVSGPAGNDYFTEMFPAFFLTAIEPAKVEVYKDGSDGGPAVIRVSGHSGEFVSLVKSFTDLVDPKQPLEYTCDYILAPGKQYLKLVVTVTNPSETSNANWSLNVPFGFVSLLGEGQRLFVPGEAGFDMRFYLEEVYKRPAALEALPGAVTPMWATAGDGVSYALVPGRQPGGTYLENKSTYYPTATKDSMLIPIASSSFLGSFWAKAPMTLPPKASYSYTAFLAVGTGDVASVQKVVYEMNETVPRANGNDFIVREPVAVGTLSGTVREMPTGQPLGGVSVVLENAKGEYITQALTLKNGVWTAQVPPGSYTATAVESTRTIARTETPIEVTAGSAARVDLTLAQPGLVTVTVRDTQGRALPAKVSIEGVYDNDVPGRLPRTFLYDLKVGERYRQSDLLPDDPANPGTRRYLEKVLFAGHGLAGAALRPGHYTVYASRGIEYDLVSAEIDVKAGETASVGLTLTQVMPTPGWVSGDFHVHSVKSVDSDMSLDDRVTSYAVEGVDLLSSTDHNNVSDFMPTVESLGLAEWVHPVVGLELTTLEMGHFNGFPLVVQPGPIQHGSFRWFFRPPGELFAQLRALGRDPQNTIVQVNHPRDTVLGYFNAFNVGTYYGKPIPPSSSIALDTSPQADGSPSPYDAVNFSLDFDAIEVFNGKRADLLFNYRIPLVDPPGDAPSIRPCKDGEPTTEDCIPARGEVLEKVVKLEEPGKPTQYLLQPMHPGAQDDWFTLLAQGHHFIATGNSDSHSEKAEAGLPRTYIHAGDTADASMRALSEDDTFTAMRAGKVLVTNGPFIDVTVNGQGLGSTVVAADGVIDLKIVVKAAPWVDVRRVTVLRGGKDQHKRPFVLDTIDVPASKDVLRLEVSKTYTGIPDGSFIVVDAAGDAPMWPVFTPHEVPSLQLTDAVAVIGGAFGFGNKYGRYVPILEEQVTPYAFTNPIWVNRSLKQPLTAAKKVLPVSNDKQFVPRTIPDLRVLFHAFHSDL